MIAKKAIAAAAFVTAGMLFCSTCSSAKGGGNTAAPTPTPSLAAAEAAPATPSTPLPVETPSGPSIYDRTPGVIYEEKGTPPPTAAEPSPTHRPRAVTPRPPRPTRTPTARG